MQARKTKHGLDGQHQDVDTTPRGRVSQNGESTSMVWPTLGLRTAKEQNRTLPGRYSHYIQHVTTKQVVEIT